MQSETSSLIVNTVSYDDEEIIDEFLDQDEKIEKKLVEHSQFNNGDISLDKKNTIESEFLKSKKWKYIYEEQESYIETNFLKIEKKLDKNTINILIENLKQFNLKKILDNYDPSDNKYSIGTLNSLEDLIERTYHFAKINKENMLSDKIRLKKMVFKYRILKKDGNSFYRGVMFNFLENVIFSKNILLMKEILILFSEKISEENPIIKEKNFLINSLKKIKKNKVINILYIIIRYMEIHYKDKKELDITSLTELTPYMILLKAFLDSNEFDEGIIFFTRYLIYEYIKDNENKFISEKKNEKKIFEIINKKNSEEFYQNLITLGQEGNTAPIFFDAVPFIFNCNLDILIYRTNDGSSAIEKIEYRKEKLAESEYEINLIFREKDFDIFYKDYFYNKYYQDLDNFIYENNKNNEFSIFREQQKLESKNLSRRISSQFPEKMPFHDLHLSSNQENEKNEVVKSNLKLSKENDNIYDNKEKIFTNDISDKNPPIKFERFSFKKKTLEEKKLDEEKIDAIMKRGEKCHRKDCPNPISKENILNLCENCKLIEIKSYMLQIYLTYLQMDINKNCKKILKQYFSKYECSFDLKKNVSIMEIINESKLDFNELFNNIRNSICLSCGKDLEEEGKSYFTLPCKCRICSKKCLEKYINLVNEKNEKVLIKEKENSKGETIIVPMTECPCGYEYKLKDFVEIIKDLQKMKLNSYINIYLKQIKNNWLWICAICRQNFRKKYNYVNIFFKDDKLDKKILNKIEYKHLICKKCALNKNIDEKEMKNENKKILCKFCESEHTIEQIKNIDDKYNIDSDCIII